MSGVIGQEQDPGIPVILDPVEALRIVETEAPNFVPLSRQIKESVVLVDQPNKCRVGLRRIRFVRRVGKLKYGDSLSTG